MKCFAHVHVQQPNQFGISTCRNTKQKATKTTNIECVCVCAVCKEISISTSIPIPMPIVNCKLLMQPSVKNVY